MLIRSRFVEPGQTVVVEPGQKPIKIQSVWVEGYSQKVYAKTILENVLSTVVLGYKDDVVEVV